MILTEDMLDAVLAKVTGAALEPDLLADLRQSFPGLHFTMCMDDDVCGPRPVREGPGVNLYLVDGSGHCMSLTTSIEAATGLVVAEVGEAP